jgi:hypothetical protein
VRISAGEEVWKDILMYAENISDDAVNEVTMNATVDVTRRWAV